jgi:hypothetical protein
VLVLLWAKGPNEKDIHEEIFPLYGGECLLHKVVHNWMRNVANVSLMMRLNRRSESG